MNLNDDDRAWLEKAGREHRAQQADSRRRAYTMHRGLSAYCACCGCVKRYCNCTRCQCGCGRRAVYTTESHVSL